MNVNSELAKTRKRNSKGKFLPIHGLSKTRKYKRQTRQKWEKSLSNEKKENLKNNVKNQEKKVIKIFQNKGKKKLMRDETNGEDN